MGRDARAGGDPPRATAPGGGPGDTGGGTPGGSPGDSAEGRSAGGVVDVHAHCVPEGLLEVLARDAGRHGVELRNVTVGDRAGPAVAFGDRLTPPVRHLLRDVPARRRAMSAAGVSCQVLSPWMEMTPVGIDGGFAKWWVDAFNDHLAGLTADSGGAFEGLGMVTLDSPGAAAGQLRRAVAELGLAGVEIATSLGSTRLDDPGLEPVWAAAADLGALVLVHPMTPVGTDGYRSGRLGDVVGNPAASTLAVGALVLAGVLRRFPNLRICVVHGGGFLPYQAGRFDVIAALDARPWPAGWPGEDLRRLYFDSLTHDDASLRWLVEFAGADHVMVGSDYPFETGAADPVAPVLRLPTLTADQRQAVLSGNAKLLIGSVVR